MENCNMTLTKKKKELSALSSDKIEYLTDEDQGKKRVEALKALNPEENHELESIEMLFPKKLRKMKLKMKEMKLKNGKKKRLNNKASKYKYDFQQYETIRSFGERIYTGKINIDKAEMDQRNLLKIFAEFNEKPRSRTIEGKDQERNTFESVNAHYEGRELIFNAFRSEIFPIKQTQGKGLKILTSKQMLQRLSIALAQVKASSTSKKLLNEIRRIIYSKITKKVYNNIMNSVKV